MSLGKFDEESLLEFREKALLQYGDPNLSQDFNVFSGLINRARSAWNNLTNPARPQDRDPAITRSGRQQPRNPAVTPITTSGIGRRGQTAANVASGVSNISSAAANRTTSGRGGGGGGGGRGGRGGGNSTSRPQAQRETEAQREARLRREREEAERREQERREAEERLREQREATEAARRERLRSITRDVAQRILENALESANRGQPDSESQLCQRPDGSVYGIAKGQRCVTGEPIEQRPANDRTSEISESARNNPDQQNLPAGWRTAPQGNSSNSSSSSPSATSTSESSTSSAPSSPNSADVRVSGQQTETTA